MTTALAGETITADLFNRETKKIVARGRRTTSHTGTTSIVGVLRIDDIPVVGGRTYTIIASPCQLDTTAANDHVRAGIKYTTDGSTPTTASANLPGAVAEGQQDNATFGETRTLETTYTPATDETLSLLVYVQRINGSGTVQLVINADFVLEMKVEEGGVDVGDTGVSV